VRVIADNKKRVTLPIKPGERFDVRVVGGWEIRAYQA
jgi:hypothetical protein